MLESARAEARDHLVRLQQEYDALAGDRATDQARLEELRDQIGACQLDLQQNVPLLALSPHEVALNAARALPAAVVRRWRLLPFRIEEGSLYVAGPEPPEDNAVRDMGRYTRLDLRFRLITRSNFDDLERRFISAESAA